MSPSLKAFLGHVSLLFLRVAVAGMMALHHGLPKLRSWDAQYAKFADPLGVSPPVSLALAIFGELVCPALIVVGLGTRIAAVPAVITMLVAAFGVHGSDPFGDGEHALLFACVFLALGLAGGGRFALDALFGRRGARDLPLPSPQ